MYLIRAGIFSYTDSFVDKVPSVDVINTKAGINILEGSGCCRHFSSFINDIMRESTSLTCVGYVDDPFMSEANHVINKINYNGNVYGFDAFNGCLFDFISEFEMVEIADKENMHLYYKPYAEIMFYKRSFEEIKSFLEQIRNNSKNKISINEVKEIALSALLNMENNSGLIKDFKSDTRLQLDSINEQTKEIRMKK